MPDSRMDDIAFAVLTLKSQATDEFVRIVERIREVETARKLFCRLVPAARRRAVFCNCQLEDIGLSASRKAHSPRY
jgi:hypothetical protein